MGEEEEEKEVIGHVTKEEKIYKKNPERLLNKIEF